MPAAGLRALERDLKRASNNAGSEAKRVGAKGALNIKATWSSLADAFEQAGSAKRYAKSISYDSYGSGGSIHFEIGPDKGRRQGALGNLIEFGDNDTRMGEAALKLEEPRFIEALANVGLDLLK